MYSGASVSCGFFLKACLWLVACSFIVHLISVGHNPGHNIHSADIQYRKTNKSHEKSTIISSNMFLLPHVLIFHGLVQNIISFNIKFCYTISWSVVVNLLKLSSFCSKGEISSKNELLDSVSLMSCGIYSRLFDQSTKSFWKAMSPPGKLPPPPRE